MRVARRRIDVSDGVIGPTFSAIAAPYAASRSEMASMKA